MMISVAKRHWAAMVSLIVGCLAFGSCFGDSTPQPYGTGFSELAMLVDDCADEYLVCREECLSDLSGGEQDSGGEPGDTGSGGGVVDTGSGGGEPEDTDAGGGGGPGYPGAGGGAGGLPGGEMHCFYPIGTPGGTPAATAEYVLEAYAGTQTVHIRLTFNPNFVDNTYGATSIGWNGDKGHKFKDLVGSDHAELALFNKLGNEKVHFKLDYISEGANTPSGYGTLGVLGGDGKMILGDASVVVGAMTSLGRNFNERGYSSYVVDSPATNAQYKPNASAPDWDFRVVYEAWVKTAAFGNPGFGSVSMTFVHASPSKAADNTVEVEERPCPPEWTTDNGSEDDTGTGTPGDQDTGTGTPGDQDTDTGTPGNQDTGTGTPGDDEPPIVDEEAIESCLVECETVLDDCTDDTRCNETKTDDLCIDGFGPCVDVCKVDFSICNDLGGAAECNPAFDECVKSCVTAVDECAKDAVSRPAEEDDGICDPTDPGGGVY